MSLVTVSNAYRDSPLDGTCTDFEHKHVNTLLGILLLICGELFMLMFKINSLANGQHRYKIGVNAEQLALTGTCIMHPRFNLVVVEGGEWSTTKFRKLMLQRIDWTENAPSRDKDNKKGLERDWLVAENEKGELKDMSLNECKLVFEGEQKARAFRKWGSRVCETDAEARSVLARAKMENFWSLAKGFA